MTVEGLYISIWFVGSTQGPTPKVSCPSATVTLLLLAFGPSVNNPPGPGRLVFIGGSGEEGSTSDMEVGVAVCGGEAEPLEVRMVSTGTEFRSRP
jgi:hypothetical protein